VPGKKGKDDLSHDPMQREVLEQFLGEASDQWTCLHRRWRSSTTGHSGGAYSCLLTAGQAQNAITHASWDLMYETGGPTFAQQHSGGRWRTRYQRPGADGIEALVHVRFIPGERPVQIDISEEFRLLFELLNRAGTANLYSLDESGNEVEAVRVSESEVWVRTALVRRYQAARQLHLALFIDSTVVGASYLDDMEDVNWERRDAATFLRYNAGDLGPASRNRHFSRLVGKRILSPPPRKDCGIPPFREAKRFENFIIGVDDLGRPIEYNSNPDRLGDNFGGHADAPHYMTPVSFSRAVLAKYYDRPERYTVEDGYLRCDGLWGMSIDNDQATYVIAVLGDLGRDLPTTEQVHWKSYNIPPAGPMSETAIRRAFLAQAVGPTALDLRFKNAYKDTNRIWEKSFGWFLFKPLAGDDAHLLNHLHIPLDNSQPEFDQQTLNLAKLLTDSLNARALLAIAGPGPEDEGSLDRLERFLQGQPVPNRDSIMGPLREIQAIRSSGSAHRKSGKYQKAKARGNRDLRIWMESLLKDALLSLASLRTIALAKERG
jgi:hypothetical protein